MATADLPSSETPTLSSSSLFLSAFPTNAASSPPLSFSLLSQNAPLPAVPPDIPDPNLIPNSRFVVDGFRFTGDFSVSYFLSHFHSDHYTGLGEVEDSKRRREEKGGESGSADQEGRREWERRGEMAGGFGSETGLRDSGQGKNGFREIKEGVNLSRRFRWTDGIWSMSSALRQRIRTPLPTATSPSHLHHRSDLQPQTRLHLNPLLHRHFQQPWSRIRPKPSSLLFTAA